MLKKKKTRESKCCQGCGEKGNFVTVGGMEIGAATVENSMEAPQKIKNTAIIRSSNLTSGIYPKEMKTGFRKDICTPMFIAELFTIAKIWKQPKCPSMDESNKDVRHTHTHTHEQTGIYQPHLKQISLLNISHKKEENPAICDNMKEH